MFLFTEKNKFIRFFSSNSFMDKRDDGYNVSESGNWNIADSFSKKKIDYPLGLCDVYEDVAKFGYHNILEQIQNYSMSTDELRIMGLDRLVNELLKIIGNTRFALKRGASKANAEKLEVQLNNILKILPALYRIIPDGIKKTRTVRVKPVEFSKVLNLVLEIKSSLNSCLNENDLIFTNKMEFDPKKRKAEILAKMKGD